MTDREYVFRTKEDRWSKPVGLGRHMGSARQRVVVKDQPFTLTQDGDRLSKDVKRDTVLDRYRTAIENRELGATFRIRDHKEKVVFTGRSVKDQPDSIDINGNDNADKFWGWVVAEFSAYRPRFAGSYVCKSIIGSGGVRSQHSYGNAVDVFFGSLAQQDAVFMAVVNGKCPVRVAHAISRNRIWEPGAGIHSYSGVYHSHLHTDYLPQYSGSCGVRG
jgi:hypothetical protein